MKKRMDIDMDSWKTEYVHFNFFDVKCRKVGVLVSRFTATVTEVESAERYHAKMEPGLYYVATVQAARNGYPYGCSQPRNFFNTEEEREIFISKRIADSRKRAQSKVK